MSAECVVDSEKTIETITDSSIAPEPKLISDDWEYIRRQFKICDLLVRKYEMLRESKEPRNSPGPNAKKKRKVSKSDFRRINKRLKTEDNLFWESVEESVKDGTKLFFEKYASYMSICRFEKRVILFLLCFEFNRNSKSAISKDDLIALLDFEDEPIDRICSAKYFSEDATLIKRKIVRIDRMHYIRSSNFDCMLNPLFTVFISRYLSGEDPSMDDLQEGKRYLCDEVGFTKEPELTLNRVILPDTVKDKVRFFINAYKGDDVIDALGISETIKQGTGTIFLFYGPPGTGKTMLAEAIAKELNKKMLIIEYSKILSRWIGDTDKNIASAFRVARENDHVLVMDEADSLLYNRSYATQEHDIRFVNEMLQEIERFKGIVILTTNMDDLLDQALERRVSLKVKFELPAESLRADIWRSHIPITVKYGEEIDFNMLAKRYDFAGGYIKNAVHNALRKLALRKENRLMMDDLIFGADMEKDGMINEENYRKIRGFSEKL